MAYVHFALSFDVMSPTVFREKGYRFFFSRGNTTASPRTLWGRGSEVLVGTAHRIGQKFSFVTRPNQGN